MSWIDDARANLVALREEAAFMMATFDDLKLRGPELQNLIEKALLAAEGKIDEFENHVGDVVKNDLPVLLDNLVHQVEERVGGAATRLDDFLFQLNDVAASGNQWAEMLLGLIQQVKEGILDGQKVMHAFGEGVVQFNGELRNVSDLLSELLPTVGEVQAGIREMVEELQREGFTIEDIIGRLRQQHLTYAHDFARLLEAFREGRATLQAVLEAAQKLQSAFPESEAAALADLIAEGLRTGALD